MMWPLASFSCGAIESFVSYCCFDCFRFQWLPLQKNKYNTMCPVNERLALYSQPNFLWSYLGAIRTDKFTIMYTYAIPVSNLVLAPSKLLLFQLLITVHSLYFIFCYSKDLKLNIIRSCGFHFFYHGKLKLSLYNMIRLHHVLFLWTPNIVIKGLHSNSENVLRILAHYLPAVIVCSRQLFFLLKVYLT